MRYNHVYANQITSKTETELKVLCIRHNTQYTAAYVGCIVSADKSIVYWINNSKPLP